MKPVRPSKSRRLNWPPAEEAPVILLSEITTRPETVSAAEIAKVKKQLSDADRKRAQFR